MSEELLRDRLSIFLLCGQIAIPIVVLLAYLNDGFTREEWMQINEIVLPMVAAFGGFAITHIVRSRVRRKKVRETAKSPVCRYGGGFAGVFSVFHLARHRTEGL
jgi:hypothetical protein